jgi:2-keto-4-pentenoate hydratase/2-oxohepta-3-ene-1,7-dioic acid hydratase in catechol pathway
MRLCRFAGERLGLVEGDHVRDVTAALDVLPMHRYPQPRYDVFIANLDRIVERVRKIAAESPVLPLAGLSFHSPVANPTKVIGAPVNYQKHLEEARGDAEIHHNNQIAEIRKAGLFLKAMSALVGPAEGIALRKLDRRNDHEVELAVVIGREADNAPASEAMKYIAGYAIGLDVTIRGSEDRSLRKSPDSYAVLGPWLVTADEIPNPCDLNLSLSVNGETRQNSNTRHMLLGPAQLIEFASSFYKLYPGDVILTGTPEGVSPIRPGDIITASIEKIGSMQVKVRAAEGHG